MPCARSSRARFARPSSLVVTSPASPNAPRFLLGKNEKQPSAPVPDDTAIACLIPSIRASSCSSASISGPMMNRWLSATRVMAARIWSRSGRYCAWRSSNGIVDFTRPILAARRFDRRACFAVGLAALDRLAFVVLLLPFRQADRHLHATLLVVEPHRDERHSLLDRLADQFPDFVAVQQELPAAQRLVIGVAAMAVRADVDVVEKYLAVFQAREAVAEVDATFADRLHLGAEQHDAGLERFQQVEIVECLAVLGDRGLRLLAFCLVHYVVRRPKLFVLFVDFVLS